jgi:hypothetical protein
MGYDYKTGELKSTRGRTPAVRNVDLPSLVKVHVQMSPGYAPPLRLYLPGGFEKAARKTFGRKYLIAHITTTEMADKIGMSDSAELWGPFSDFW